MVTKNAVDKQRTVSDPNAEYLSVYPIWKKTRAVCGGEEEAKAYDVATSAPNLKALLLPFSPKMTVEQYLLYQGEAELPGIVSEFTKMMVGGLLRKAPSLELGDKIPPEAANWILNDFAEDSRPLMSFLDEALWEELQTGSTWIHLDMPSIADEEDGEDIPACPYPVLWPAETVINWRFGKNKRGEKALTRIIVKGLIEKEGENEFHPDYVETVWVHELNKKGDYQVRVFERENKETNINVIAGRKKEKDPENAEKHFKQRGEVIHYRVNGEALQYIPVWPLNGDMKPNKPIILTLVNKEVALYNKLSRRNHLLYGAATYTPIVKSDMNDEDFDALVDAGLGSWLKIGKEDEIETLRTPTDSLNDMEKAISANIEEMAKLGVRMLSPEVEQSGVALEIRNASQNAQLGSLNVKTSDTIKNIIATMISWKYKLDLEPGDVNFTLSSDFNPIPLGADWLRLVTEWYEAGYIPRSLWLLIVKQNDLIPGDYDDAKGKEEMVEDETNPINPKPNLDFVDTL